MEKFDGVVIGAGHNGLTLAAYLARAGLKIAVIERNPHIGGGCITEEPALAGRGTLSLWIVDRQWQRH
jgi:phytoene dehydrogenase-like protein